MQGARNVAWSRDPADPFPMLRALAEGRLPEGIPQVGDYEIELKPEGPVTATKPKGPSVR